MKASGLSRVLCIGFKSNDVIKYLARAIEPKIERHALKLPCDFERQHKVTWK